MKKDWWKAGSYNAICDRCGFKFKAEELFETYDGLRVCKVNGCWEVKHPLEMVRQFPRVPDKLPFVRPERENPDVGPAINCDFYHPPAPLHKEVIHSLTSDFTIISGSTEGPVTIPDGVTITVICTWEIT